MNFTKITLILDRAESAALNQSATTDLRQPRDQARYLIRQSLGLVQHTGCTASVEQQQRERDDKVVS